MKNVDIKHLFLSVCNVSALRMGVYVTHYNFCTGNIYFSNPVDT